jgi:hypothetical protein
MKLGFALPNIGPIATAEGVSKVAQRAEALGFDSLWTVERLLYPVKPQTPYPVTPDGSLPEPYKHALDPLETLTFAAAQTKKIALGPSVLDIPYLLSSRSRPRSDSGRDQRRSSRRNILVVRSFFHGSMGN